MLKIVIFLFLTFAVGSLIASDQKDLKDVIPATMSNLKGHRFLYNEGWYVVTSTKKAIEYAHQKMLKESGGNFHKIGTQSISRAETLKENIKQDAASSLKFGKNYHREGSDVGKTIKGAGKNLSEAQLERSKKGFSESWERFTLGYMALSPQTKNDWQEIKNYNSQLAFFIKEDFGKLKEWLDSQGVNLSAHAEISWEKSFSKAGEEFHKEYEDSGKEKNTLMALPHIFWGYCKALYYGLARPGEKSVVEGGKTVVKSLAYPLVGSIILANRSFLSLGTNFLFVGKSIVRVFSPTVEGGFLATLAFLNGASAPLIRGGSEGLYAINQVVVTSTAPLAGTGTFAISSAGDVAAQTALLTYDVGKGAAELLINQTQAAAVLGYNAITALPTQTVLGLGNAIIFISWDGPRLALYTLKGEVNYSPPAGLVLDQKKIESDSQLKIEKISDDPELIRKVLEKIPEDLREKKE